MSFSECSFGHGSPSAPVTTCFAVRGDAAPGLLPRVIEPFVKRGLQIQDVHARIVGSGEEACQLIDLQIAGMSDAAAETAAEALRQIVGVERVLLARKRIALAA
jgi:acetolactate synthase regulatory subunit